MSSACVFGLTSESITLTGRPGSLRPDNVSSASHLTGRQSALAHRPSAAPSVSPTWRRTERQSRRATAAHRRLGEPKVRTLHRQGTATPPRCILHGNIRVGPGRVKSTAGACPGRGVVTSDGRSSCRLVETGPLRVGTACFVRTRSMPSPPGVLRSRNLHSITRSNSLSCYMSLYLALPAAGGGLSGRIRFR